jgi:hypothetical protein
VAANTDLTLGVTLRGTTASVTLNGQAVAAFTFNGVAVDGRFGLFGRGAGTSFDSVTVKTNDNAATAAVAAQGSSSTTTTSAAMAAPTGTMSALSMESAPTIDWTMPTSTTSKIASASTTGTTTTSSTTTRSTSWQTRFVNNLAVSPDKLHPNAALTVRVPVSSSVSPNLSRL